MINASQIHSLDSTYRSKLIHSLSGYKGAHLIGSIGADGQSNVVLISSVVHISANPARIGFIMQPDLKSKNTYHNILETGFFTINHVHKSMVEQAHFADSNFNEKDSNFELCNLTEVYVPNFQAPFVGESTVKFGLKWVEDIAITGSDSRLIIGEVQCIDSKKEYLLSDGQLDLELAFDVCVTGINQYSSVNKFKQLADTTTLERPNFKQKKRPDNVVFDEASQSYNASMLPYATNVGAPSIKTNELSSWKSSGVRSFNQVLKSKIDEIKNEYSALVETYEINEMVYHSKYEFEPIIGETYHLYERDNTNENFLSIIPPETWKRKHLGSFKLNSEKVWKAINTEDVRIKEAIAPRNF